MKRNLTFVLIFLSSLVFAQHQVGHKQLTFTDPARSNRSIPCDVFYPATTAGEDVPMATGQFPLLVFGHGFIMGDPDLYQYLWDAFAVKGYICVFPTTENGSIFPPPNHLEFGLDLSFLSVQVNAENTQSASFFYGKLTGKTAIMGHSMGGKAAFIGVGEGNSEADVIVTMGAAISNPPIGTAVDVLGEYANQVSIPNLVISGEFDCVAAPDDNQKPLYDTCLSACKTHVTILGGGHCYFASQAGSGMMSCESGESCSSSFTIDRPTQNATVLEFLEDYLDYYLKSNSAAGVSFLAYLTSSPKITYNRECGTTWAEQLAKDPGSLTLSPNPATNSLHIDAITEKPGSVTVSIYDVQGKVVMTYIFDNSGYVFSTDIDISQLPTGLYLTIVQSGMNKYTERLVKQ
ncbi:MAG: T9SS type A sorting domain-containing protein [Bacteroidetes bacterium]|nr:T9SS type A sorting domain-containing protein [Bacteroidota bacterium]MBU1717548.1 T9SS type A sorting domain-containing protein [Bacteroidota bacterium]